ncbi:phosphoenolpyruvate synthase [bacterium DOLZORAL124_64_63]|nr:MAG: phosphoenolpyruvate synthase [bacterium DOLZORAL124_64_63]
MKVQFGTKAETLERLAGKVTTGRVLPQLRFTVARWRRDADGILADLAATPWGADPVIVRSSGLGEDTDSESLAGHFCSVLDVRGEPALRQAVEKVAASFGQDAAADQIFIQPMVGQVALAGVAFTRDPRGGGHYDVINFDESGSTDAVTSGRSNDVRTLYLEKRGGGPQAERFAGLVRLLRELEDLLGNDALDVEFALAGDRWHLLQVRPLVVPADGAMDAAEQRRTLDRVRAKVAQLSKPHPYLHGTRSVFGIMPDWNPAEIIGVRPRPLALSTYKELVTDSVWAYQRNNYGYLNLRSFPLLVSLAGLPYIDVRVSFNSFIPADVPEELAERLVNHYIDRLVEKPQKHDKVEFEVIYSCYTMDLDQRLRKLRDAGFNADDCRTLSDSLRRLTNRIVHKDGLWKTDIEKISKLRERQEIIAGSGLPAIEAIYWLLEDCKRYGTLPFAGLARAGFIAVQMLHSLVETGVLRRGDFDNFMASLETVSSKMARDLRRLSREEFLRRYGHLRPGTYDLTSRRYDEEPDRYFRWDAAGSGAPTASQEDRRGASPEFSLSMAQMNRLEDMLAEHRIEHGVLSLFNFIKGAIEGREFAKFVFTRSLSEALRLFGELGAEHGFSREDMSFADIEVVGRLYGGCGDVREVLAGSIAEGRRRFAAARQINLPPLITSPDDVDGFAMPVNEPNFVTLGAASGRVVRATDDASELAGAILMIPSADPGFDWIFAHGVAGFITMFGGVNSHMAIRAAELGIPAVIGAGESLYRTWAAAEVLEIDCAQARVSVLR